MERITRPLANKRNSFLKLVFLLVMLSPLSSCSTILGEAGPEDEGRMAGSGSTFPYDRYVEGQPNVDLRIEGGFFIWRTGNDWHVRIAKRLDRPRGYTPYWPIVSGLIRVNGGLLVNMKNYNISRLNEALNVRNSVSFKFELRDNFANDIEGFDFSVRPQGLDYCVTVDVMTNGVSTPDLVHLGSFMHKPESLPLPICLRSFE